MQDIDDDDDGGETFTPTTAEITEGCRLAQMTWSDAERMQRRRWRPGKVADATGVEASARQRLEASLLSRRGGGRE